MSDPEGGRHREFETMIQILVLTAVAVIVLYFTYVAFAVIRSKIRKVIDGIQNLGRPARRIHLIKKTEVEWQDPEKVQALVQPLTARGFRFAGLFEIPEMPGLRLQAFVNLENGALGAVYEYPKRGVWLDLGFRFEDGRGLTCTTNRGPSLEARPGFPTVRQEEQDSAMLYERLVRERPADRKVMKVRIDDFVPLFEKAYADEMDWRAAKGLSSSELRNTAVSTGHADASETALNLSKAIYDAQQLRNLDESFRERFAAQQKIPQKDWEAMQKRVVVVHDHLPADTVRKQFEKLSKQAGLYEQLPQSSAESIRQQFAELNGQILSGKGFRKLGEVTIHPLTADVWQSPE